MIRKIKILFFMTALIASINGQSNIFSEHWLNTCRPNICSETAFSLCWNCFGERVCKSCIAFSKPECSLCADSIYNKVNLETINASDYLICDSMDPVQSKVCHLFCRGQFAQSGECVYEKNLPICKCSSQPGPTTIPMIQTVNFNGTVKLNVSINGNWERILPIPNGDLVRGNWRNYIEIWDIEKGVIKRNLTSGYSHPYVFGLLSNGDLVAGYNKNKTLLVWDLKKKSGEPLKRIMQTNEIFQCLTVLKNDDLAIGQEFLSDNFDIVIRDSQYGSIKHRLVGHKSRVLQITEMENGNLVSCSDDRTVKVWNVKYGVILNSITHTNALRSFMFLNNGFLVSSLWDGTINIWNLETNKLIRNLIGHTSAICHTYCLHVLGNGELLSASYDRSLKVWNPYDGRVKFTSKLHKSKAIQLAVLPSGNFITSSLTELVVWN